MSVYPYGAALVETVVAKARRSAFPALVWAVMTWCYPAAGRYAKVGIRFWLWLSGKDRVRGWIHASLD